MRFPRTTGVGSAKGLKFPWTTELRKYVNTPWNGAAIPSSAKQAETIKATELTKLLTNSCDIVLNQLACDVRSFKDQIPNNNYTYIFRSKCRPLVLLSMTPRGRAGLVLC